MPGKFYRYQYSEGEIVKLKKKHPCGSHEWTVMSAGAEIKLKCLGCSHVMSLGRESLEKATIDVRNE